MGDYTCNFEDGTATRYERAIKLVYWLFRDEENNQGEERAIRKQPGATPDCGGCVHCIGYLRPCPSLGTKTAIRKQHVDVPPVQQPTCPGCNKCDGTGPCPSIGNRRRRIKSSRCVMDRLLRYENHYSSGAERYPPKESPKPTFYPDQLADCTCNLVS